MPFQNVFWYRLENWGGFSPGSPVANDLALNFQPNVGAALRDVMVVGSTIDRTEIVDYGDPTDFDVCIAACGWPLVGTRVGQPLPAYVCLSYRFDRPFPGQRSGWKRFSALSESDIAGDKIDAGLQAAVDALEAEIAQILIGPGGAIFQPVVPTGVKLLGTNPTVWESVGVTFAGVGSQVSRKPPLAP